jgi:AraC-like DNA-binding protein
MPTTVTSPLGLTARSTSPGPAPFGNSTETHQHTEIELIVYEHGPTTMFYGGRTVRLPPGQLAVFWGAMPHQALDADPAVVAHLVRVPLPLVQQWALPDWFMRRLLDFDVLLEPAETGPGRDLDLLKHWVGLINRRSPEAERIVILEVEARLRRMALDQRSSSVVTPRPAGASRLERMANVIAQRCLEPLRITEVARAAGLTRAYATRLFHREIGMTMLEYITRQRVSHAQRLLATSERGVLDILQECGFRSPTRFYTVFRRFAGCTPGHYRRRLHPLTQPRRRRPAAGSRPAAAALPRGLR